MASRLESALQKQIIAHLNKHRILHWRIHVGTLSNFPDILILYKGKFIGCELKRDEKSKARSGQLNTLRIMEEHGGVCAVVGSLEQLKDLLKRAEET